MTENQTITVNLDQLENQIVKTVIKYCETMRMVIDAQAREIQELRAKVVPANGTEKAPEP